MRIYGLSGTQGCGKTTLISNIQKMPQIAWETYSSVKTPGDPLRNLIAQYGSDAEIIPHQPTVLRTILKNHGITFDGQYYSRPINVVRVQSTALVSMLCSDIARLQKNTHTSVFSMSDRTYLDLEAYTRSYLHMYAEYDGFVSLYSEFCRLAASIVYDGIFLLDFPNRPVADDGVRPMSAVSQQVVHAIMQDIGNKYPTPIQLQQGYPHDMAQTAYFNMLRHDNARHNIWTQTQRRLMIESLLSTITNDFRKFLLE